MRVLHAATLVAAVAFLTGPVASAQSLGEAAAKEKAKRKGKPEPAKVFTDDDLRNAGGVASSPGAVDAPATADGQAKPAEGAKAGEAKKEKTPDEIQAEQQAAWRKKVDHAQSEVTRIQGIVNDMQRDLNDTSGGVYTPRRAGLQSKLDEAQKNLAIAQQMLADAQDEGRRNGYR